MAKPSQNDLFLQLGDLAREHLVNASRAPKELEKVFDCEDQVLALRAELKALEKSMNEVDAEYQDFLERFHVEKGENEKISAKWRTAVSGVVSRTRDLRSALSSQRVANRYQKRSLALAEKKHNDLEQREGHDEKKVQRSRENLKHLRLQLMRHNRQLEEMQYELDQVLTPRPGQPGAQGILAHKRLIELEDEAEQRAADHQDAMKTADENIAACESDLDEAEERLDDALFELGEACYEHKLKHPALTALYSQLDRLK